VKKIKEAEKVLGEYDFKEVCKDVGML